MLILCVLSAQGCAGSSRIQGRPVEEYMGRGEFGRARVQLENRRPAARGDRQYMLDRMQLLLASMADGQGQAIDPLVEDVYEVLRTQGINRDKTVSSVVLNEDLKFWKGEPFEQALTLNYIALHYAQQGSWDNARAAAMSSLFHLKHFGDGVDSEDLIQQAQARGDAYLDHGYVSVRSNFALGYLIAGIANQQLGRHEEASDQFAAALEFNPGLASLIDQLRAHRYNAILVVDYGRGPRKVGSGPDQAIARFEPLTRSDRSQLAVTTHRGTQRFALACDVNQMARDHMWNNLEDVRLAKSYIGSALMGAGAITAVYGGTQSGKDGAVYAGLGMLLAGAIAKAGAHADTRYCELLPQRVYVAAVELGPQDRTVQVQIDGHPYTRMVLTGWRAPESGERALLRYVRLIHWPLVHPPAWAISGQVHYASDAYPDVPVQGLVALGGNDCRQPTERLLQLYQQAGQLQGMSLGEIRGLYRSRGFTFDLRDTEGKLGLHVLEGGNSLVSPLPGTAGFTRLYGQVHKGYEANPMPRREEGH